MIFKRKTLTTAVALICAGGTMTFTAGAAAQQADDASVIEEVVVTGIRASMQRAMDVKREAGMIVDGIAAEDLGKFPDQNVAESLQRITGISIDRDGGEGRKVTVRGFGPEFTAVLYNGRVLATEGQGRDFSFDVLAADVINGADAYKTTTADMLAGGIGATINLSTAKPMDNPGLNSAFTVKGTYDTLLFRLIIPSAITVETPLTQKAGFPQVTLTGQTIQTSRRAVQAILLGPPIYRARWQLKLIAALAPARVGPPCSNLHPLIASSSQQMPSIQNLKWTVI
jgi:hypothetical protein